MCGIYECKITSSGTLEVTDNIVSTNEISVENSVLWLGISPCVRVLLVRNYRLFLSDSKVWPLALEVCPSYQPNLQASAKTFLSACLPACVCLHFGMPFCAWQQKEREECWVLAAWNLASCYAMLLERVPLHLLQTQYMKLHGAIPWATRWEKAEGCLWRS